jgi:hypothetical protein
MYKRSSSQNIPIWEHKRSSSIILIYTQLVTIKINLGGVKNGNI